jgi:hypothetical protein
MEKPNHGQGISRERNETVGRITAYSLALVVQLCRFACVWLYLSGLAWSFFGSQPTAGLVLAYQFSVLWGTLLPEPPEVPASAPMWLIVILFAIAGVLAFYGTLLIHEVGHIVAGAAGGFKPIKIRVYDAVIIFHPTASIRWRKRRKEIHRAYAFSVPMKVRNVPLSYALKMAGGSAFNLLCAVGLLGLSAILWSAPRSSLLVASIALFNLVCALGALIPKRYRHGLSSDGMRIRDLFKNDPKQLYIWFCEVLDQPVNDVERHQPWRTQIVDKLVQISLDQRDQSNFWKAVVKSHWSIEYDMEPNDSKGKFRYRALPEVKSRLDLDLLDRIYGEEAIFAAKILKDPGAVLEALSKIRDQSASQAVLNLLG